MKVTAKTVKEFAAKYQAALMQYGARNLVTERAWADWQHMKTQKEEGQYGRSRRRQPIRF